MSFCDPCSATYTYSNCYPQDPCYDPCPTRSSYWGSRRCRTVCDTPPLFNTYYSSPGYSSYSFSPYGGNYYRYSYSPPMLNMVDVVATGFVGLACLAAFGVMLVSSAI